MMADPRPRSCQKRGGQQWPAGQVFAVDTGRRQGWELRVVVEGEVGPLRAVLRGVHWLPAACVSPSGWLTASCQGYEGTWAFGCPFSSVGFCAFSCDLAANQLTNAACSGLYPTRLLSQRDGGSRTTNPHQPQWQSWESTQQNGVTTDPQPLAGSRMARPFFSRGTLHGNNNTDRARPWAIPAQAASHAGFGNAAIKNKPQPRSTEQSPSVATWKRGRCRRVEAERWECVCVDSRIANLGRPPV